MAFGVSPVGSSSAITISSSKLFDLDALDAAEGDDDELDDDDEWT